MPSKEFLLGDLFTAHNGKAVYIRDYVDNNPGKYPVYSASLSKPFGFVDSYDYEGSHLTWVMNGYGGRCQELSGKFSANRDRGVLIPKEFCRKIDLTYVRYAVEPELVANAVGRRVDGKLNEYTKIYPETALQIGVELPTTAAGSIDFDKMRKIGARLREIEKAQRAVHASMELLEEARFAFEIPAPSHVLSLGDADYFRLSIGKRILLAEHSSDGIPAYSANARTPFGNVSKSNLTDFSKASIIWGIDGNFDWNFIDSNVEFATTDHCGRLQVVDPSIDPEYTYWYLRLTASRYGFDRVYRANLENIKSDVTIEVPVDEEGCFSIEKQRQLVLQFKQLDRARDASVDSLKAVLRTRLSLHL
jgi:restriction endonuclease S subunit